MACPFLIYQDSLTKAILPLRSFFSGDSGLCQIDYKQQGQGE